MGETTNSSRPEAVSFQVVEVTIAGTFVDVSDRRAAVLILSGSGQLDRDSNSPKLKLHVSDAIAAALGDDGFATLRYDKRGVGESEGKFLSAGVTDNYADAVAALGWLSTRCPDLPIFVIGHSEGALHAAHLAAEEKVDGIVLLACPAHTGEEILTWQAREITKTLPGVTKTILKMLRIDPLESQQKQFVRFRSTSADVIRVHGKKMNARWFRQFLDYDPKPIFGRVKVPVQALTGGHDMQIPPEDVEAIKHLVKGSCEARIVGDLSHLLRADPESKGPRDYRRAVRQPIDPGLLVTITGWMPH
jgi:alpha/beta superfamily hydrolase